MIRKVNQFFIFRPGGSARSSALLSPEEDAVIVSGGPDDIDETLPADLWFRRTGTYARRRRSRL
jgi:hypothetical protein